MPLASPKPEFRDAQVSPDTENLRDTLQTSFAAYEHLVGYLATHGLELSWKYYKDGSTWLCKIVEKKNTIAWLSAWPGYFMTTVYISRKYAVELASVPVAPDTMRAMMDAGEGRKNIPCTFTIMTIQDLSELYAVMEFKMGHR